MYVTNLSPLTSESDLRRIFSPFGMISEVVLLQQRPQPSLDGLANDMRLMPMKSLHSKATKGSAFIKFSSRSEAEAAVEAFNNSQLLQGGRDEVRDETYKWRNIGHGWI